MHNIFTKFSSGAKAGNVTYSMSNDGVRPIQVLYGQVVLTTDATVANRYVSIRMTDDASAVFSDVHAGAAVPASQTSQHHEFMQGVYRETSFIDDALQVPIPVGFFIPPGWTCDVVIENGVAGDSYTAKFIAQEV